MKEFGIQNTFNFEKKILSFSCIYINPQTQTTALKKLRGLIFALLSCLLEVSLLILIFLNIRNLGHVMGALMLFVQQAAFISKASLLIYKSEELKSLEMKLEEFSDDPFVESDKILVQNNLNNISKVAFIYRVSCAVCCTFLGVGPLINHTASAYELPMPGHIPYKITNGLEYTVTFLFQIGSLYLAAALNTTVDILNCKLITVASSLLEILIKRLNNIGYENIGNQQDEFRKCVIFHINILRFVQGIEDLYSYIVFSQFAASVIVICSTAFELLTLPVGSGEFIGSLMYLINMITEVALYCWYGHNIQALSENLGTACYSSKWYETDPKTKTMIKIFMEKTKRPVILTAAKLFPLTLMTLRMILRSSYSYFAVLQRVYSDK